MNDRTDKDSKTVSPSLQVSSLKTGDPLPCRKCGSTERHTKKRGKYSWRDCSNCQRSYNRNWQKKNAKRLADHRRKWLYGLTPDQHASMVERQMGLCGSCHKKPIRLVVDHDHVSGAVRALLCDSCNLGLGAFQDSIEAMELAIVYLKRFGK